MQLVALVFVIPWEALYMFRVLFAPIIRSVLKLNMPLLVQLYDCTNNCMYSFKTLLMMGVKSTRNM
jgi:hypothetical protein